MQTKFSEISEITRISAIKLRTFASDEKAAKFRCYPYCSNVGEISQARWLIETKFPCMRRNFVAKFRARWTKFRVIRTKFRFDEAKFRFGETKYRLDETKFRFHETKFCLSRIGSWLPHVKVQVHVSVITIEKRNIATIATIVERFWRRTVLFDS